MLAIASRSLSRLRRQSQETRRSTATGFPGCKIHGQGRVPASRFLPAERTRPGGRPPVQANQAFGSVPGTIPGNRGRGILQHPRLARDAYSERQAIGTPEPLPSPPLSDRLHLSSCKVVLFRWEHWEQWEQPHEHWAFLFPSPGNRLGTRGNRSQGRPLGQIYRSPSASSPNHRSPEAARRRSVATKRA